jgi:hypothetical protein
MKASSLPARVWPGLPRQAGQEDDSVGQESEDSYRLTTGGALQSQGFGGGGNMTFSWTDPFMATGQNRQKTG